MIRTPPAAAMANTAAMINGIMPEVRNERGDRRTLSSEAASGERSPQSGRALRRAGNSLVGRGIHVQFNPAVYDLWVFRRRSHGVEFLVLRTSQTKADRYFNGGRFWQIVSGFFQNGESVPTAVDRELAPYGLTARAVWAAEHTYTIYNRRFHEIQIISVFAVETDGTASVRLNPQAHSEYEWLPYEVALARVHYRGLKDGLRSTHDYIVGVDNPAPELRLR